MKKIIILITLFYSMSTISAEINLVCKNLTFLDIDSGKVSNTPGTFSYEGTHLSDGGLIAIMNGDTSCAVGMGTVSSSEYTTTCSRNLEGGNVSKSIVKINRYSGDYEREFLFNEKLLSISYGSCSKAKQKF